MTSEAFWLRELRGLRTPLNDIIDTSERFGPVDNRYREYPKHIHDSARNLLDLVVRTIDMVKAKVESNKDAIIEPSTVAMLLDGLRTPLYAIIGFSEMMVRELCGPIDGRHRTWADHIHANGMILSDSIEG
jgi:signal transduction histidine kinase